MQLRSKRIDVLDLKQLSSTILHSVFVRCHRAKSTVKRDDNDDDNYFASLPSIIDHQHCVEIADKANQIERRMKLIIIKMKMFGQTKIIPNNCWEIRSIQIKILIFMIFFTLATDFVLVDQFG